MNYQGSKEGNRTQMPGCSAFFVPAYVVHVWRRNQKVIDLDRLADKHLGDKVLNMEKAIEHDTVLPPDKQMIVARKLGEFLTSKKTCDATSAITTPINMAAAATASKRRWGETAMSEDERFLSEIPPSYRVKAKKLMHVWSQRHDVGRRRHCLFKGEGSERSQSIAAPAPRIIWEMTRSAYWFRSRDQVYGCRAPTFHSLRKSTVEKGDVG